jgi:hypothetical protein
MARAVVVAHQFATALATGLARQRREVEAVVGLLLAFSYLWGLQSDAKAKAAKPASVIHSVS